MRKMNNRAKTHPSSSTTIVKNTWHTQRSFGWPKKCCWAIRLSLN